MPIRVASSGFDGLEQRLTREVESIKVAEVEALAADLQRTSPRGATRRLQAGWLVVLRGRRSVVLVNLAEESQERVVGHPPGGAITRERLIRLRRWVEVVLGIPREESRAVAWFVARRINQLGTERWRTQQNILDMRRDGSLRPGSPALVAADRIARRLRGLVIR